MWAVELQDENSAFQLRASRMRGGSCALTGGSVCQPIEVRSTSRFESSELMFEDAWFLAVLKVPSLNRRVDSRQRGSSGQQRSNAGLGGCSADLYSRDANSSRALTMGLVRAGLVTLV